MKIRFINEERTEAVVTRGWWRWRKVATIKRIGSKRDGYRWIYVNSGREFEYYIGIPDWRPASPRKP